MTPEKLRDGIFSINTRRFGTVAEVMIQKILGLENSKDLSHDLLDPKTGEKVEVKFSTVRKKNSRPITKDTVLDCIQDELAENRKVEYLNEIWKNFDFDCNIQQIKREKFKILYYGLFFHDRILIFKILSNQIMTPKEKEKSGEVDGGKFSYSNKQHAGNEGEGQFHINPQTFQIHIDNYIFKEVTYKELLDLLI